MRMRKIVFSAVAIAIVLIPVGVLTQGAKKPLTATYLTKEEIDLVCSRTATSSTDGTISRRI
jgi:hypothetical protein